MPYDGPGWTYRPDGSFAYGYDTLDRLTNAWNGLDYTQPPGPATLSQAFGYDAAHNMTGNSMVGAYAYPAQGQGAARPHAATQAGAQSQGSPCGLTVVGGAKVHMMACSRPAATIGTRPCPS
jgi:hypothetical protein